MKNKKLLVVIIVVVVLAAVYLIVRKTEAPIIDDIQIVDNTMPQIENKGEILGNKDDLVAFSIAPGTKVRGILSYRGVIKGGYFFEGNILVNILDKNQKVLKQSNAVAKTDWMTDKSVDFEGNIDFTGLKKGEAYFEIHNDNASGLPENDKSILIPIIIE